MKKIALTLVAVSALGVAACKSTAGNNTANQANSSGEAVEDTNGALSDMRENANGAEANGTEANAAEANGAEANSAGNAAEGN